MADLAAAAPVLAGRDLLSLVSSACLRPSGCNYGPAALRDALFLAFRPHRTKSTSLWIMACRCSRMSSHPVCRLSMHASRRPLNPDRHLLVSPLLRQIQCSRASGGARYYPSTTGVAPLLDAAVPACDMFPVSGSCPSGFGIVHT